MSCTTKAGLARLAWLTGSRSGFGTAASTANLNAITPHGSITDPLWAHIPAAWLGNMGNTIGLVVIFTLPTWLRIRRLSPGQSR